MTNDVRGIITVLNTPFTAEDAIDLPGLTKNVRNAISAGVAGFLVPAMASEVGHLTPDEKQQIVSRVVDESQGRVVVIGGASADTQEERYRLAKQYINLGCDGVLVQLNAQSDVSELQNDLTELASLKPKLLMVQDWDADGPGIPLNVIKQLFETIERFSWLKIEVADAGPKYTDVLNLTAGNLNVAGGWAVTQMIDGLNRGVHAFMPTGMHAIYAEICRRFYRGDRNSAAELFRRIQPVLDFSNQSLGVSIVFFKRLLHAQGIYATPAVRIPDVHFTREQESMADELIDVTVALESEIARGTQTGA